jgi:chemotaxis protein methyltransferase CheR
MNLSENTTQTKVVMENKSDPKYFQPLTLSDKEFFAFKELIYNRLGINLTDQKRALLAGRLQKVLRKHGFTSYYAYYKYLVADETNMALSELADRISTNHTYFYREKEHFDFFVKMALPEAEKRHSKSNDYDLRIWCAGCSSGEEAYLLTMLMMEYFNIRGPNWNAGILATDISSKVLDYAKAGLYSSDRMHTLPEFLRSRYFREQPNGDWLIRNTVREQVTFRRFNLMNSKFPFKKKFDIIFCRNVMIYFDEETKNALTNRMSEWLLPGGYLFIGHSETLRWHKESFEYVMPAVYRKRGS